MAARTNRALVTPATTATLRSECDSAWVCIDWGKTGIVVLRGDLH